MAAIIAEFNPLHKGHEYIIQQAREATGATHVLVIQSGNFTQRAEPAISEKYARAKTAIEAGADAVVEIPVAYATGNAEVFAKAGVKIAASFPHVSHLVFGTESENIGLIRQIANVQIKRKKDFERYITGHLKKGISFERARCEVVKKLLPKIPAESIDKTMNTPNNILAIEYIKEIIELDVKITPIGIKRIRALSATTIRGRIYERDTAARTAYETYSAIALFSTMTRLNATIYNSNTELVNLVKNLHPVTYAGLKADAPTKRFSVSRIARLALHSTLDIKKTDIEYLYKHTYLPYTNLLAINIEAPELFPALCLNSRTPLIVRGNKIKPKSTEYLRALRRIDERAELLYEAITQRQSQNRTEFVRKNPKPALAFTEPLQIEFT